MPAASLALWLENMSRKRLKYSLPMSLAEMLYILTGEINSKSDQQFRCWQIQIDKYTNFTSINYYYR